MRGVLDPRPETVWVVVLNYNGAELLPRALAGLLPTTRNRATVLVVDDASTDESADHVSVEFPEVRLLRLPYNRGFAGAVNAGFREARRNGAQFAVEFPNDNVPEPEWLEALLSALSPGIGAVMPMSENEDLPEPLRFRWGGLNLMGRNVLLDEGVDPERIRPIFYSSGNGVLLRLDSIQDPCDEDYRIYYEDVAQGWGLRLRGYEVVFQPRARLHHVVGATLKRTPFRRVYLAERNRLITLAAYYGRDSMVRLLPLLAIDTVIGWMHPIKIMPRVTAAFWFFSAIPWVLRKREKIQSMRTVTEREILAALRSEIVHATTPAARWMNALSFLYARVMGLDVAR